MPVSIMLKMLHLWADPIVDGAFRPDEAPSEEGVLKNIQGLSGGEWEGPAIGRMNRGAGINSQSLENGGVKVFGAASGFGRSITDGVGFPIDLATLHAASGESD